MAKIKLSPFERQLILKYGCLLPGMKTKLKRFEDSDESKVITFTSFDLDMVSGDLSRSLNHGQVPSKLIDAVDELCCRLEAEM